MSNVVCFKPGVADSRTAFEAMTPIYRYLENNYEYNFTIIISSSDTYSDKQLEVVSIPDSKLRNLAWEATKYIDHLPVSLILPSGINRYFEKADAVITVDPTSRAAGIIGIKKANSTNTPVWFDAGRTTMRPFRGYRWIKRYRVFARAVRNSTGIIVTSPKVFEYFGDLGLVDENIAQKFTVLGHPTNTEEFTPSKPNRNSLNSNLEILTIARLVPEKGLYYILEALDPVLSEQTDHQWTIIGEGPLEHLLKQEIRARGLTNSINIRETVPHNQVPNLLQEADIFVNHSVDVAAWEEFFGAANIEAMASGLPCVLSNSGSIPYVARDPVGVELVPQRDVKKLRQCVQKLIEDPSRRIKMGQSARRFVELEYSVEVIGDKYHQMLQGELTK